MAARKGEKEYRVTCTLTDRDTGITKNIEELTEQERKRAAVIIGMRLLKQKYGPNATVELTNPNAMELYGIKSL